MVNRRKFLQAACVMAAVPFLPLRGVGAVQRDVEVMQPIPEHELLRRHRELRAALDAAIRDAFVYGSGVVRFPG